VRPGLVIGGGLFARQRAALLRTPIVPLIGAGQTPVAVIGIDHFLEALLALIEQNRPGLYRLFYEPQPSMREFVSAVKVAAGRRAHFLSLPAPVALFLVRAAQALGLPVPVNPDQVLAVFDARSAEAHSDLDTLLPEKRSQFTLAYALRN